ncbi:MAG TPA: hypothetical protein VGN56_01500, partial [Candidatus Paceibacterota bacterium]|nr:hypothetical protein [Candidatus Paceibacterota bacterium]
LHTHPRGGYLMLLAIVFGTVFLTVLGALSSYVLTENHSQSAATGRSKALAMAEAGLEYYRWHLAHFPTDLQNGTGHAGPYTYAYNDPEGGSVGTVTLGITGNQSCGQITSIDINSTGTPNDGTNVSRTLYARYAQPTVAQYSYILNDSVWAGSDRVINGPYHSNGGIRMDGTANAPVTSSVSSWSCTSSFGCSPTKSVNGVFGTGPNQNLWSYPTPQLDFSGIAADFSSLKTKAQAASPNGGIYLARVSTGTNTTNANYWKGYHLTFNANGTVTVKKVTGVTALSVTPVNSADATTDYALISSETSFNTYTIPSACGLIFVEDNVWVDGVIPSKVTLVAANVTTSGIAPNAMLKGNITYANSSAGLTLIAENDVLITPDSPSAMSLNGIFVAQGGAFGRNYYGAYGCGGTYEPRASLTIHGTTVSNKRTGTKWLDGCGTGSDAGYQTRIDAYDRTLATDPPPFTPVISTVYQFVDWREE